MQRNQVIKAVKEMVLAPSIKESEAESPDGADQTLRARAAQRVITTSCALLPPSGILQILSSTNIQTAALPHIILNILDIQVIIKYYRTLQ